MRIHRKLAHRIQFLTTPLGIFKEFNFVLNFHIYLESEKSILQDSVVRPICILRSAAYNTVSSVIIYEQIFIRKPFWNTGTTWFET